jgi:hypothetical protein
MGALNDFVNYLKGQTANVGSTPSSTQSKAADAVTKHRITVLKPGAATSGDDAAAATDIAETCVFVNLTGSTLTLTKASYACGNTGITGLDANAPTLTLFSRNSTGANQLSMATLAFNTALGTLTVGQQAAFTLSGTPTNLVIPVGGSITLTRTHAGVGIVVPGGTITIEYVEN